MTKELNALAIRVVEWRIRQGFTTPSTLTDRAPVMAKLALIQEEVGEAMTATRKVDFLNLREELADIGIRLLDLIGTMRSTPERALNRFLMPSMRVENEEELYQRCLQACGHLYATQLPKSIDDENERMFLLACLFELNGEIYTSMGQASRHCNWPGFEAGLGLVLVMVVGLAKSLGIDLLDAMLEKQAINDKRPPRNGKVSAL